jgi:lysophospholipase L1-like esterase
MMRKTWAERFAVTILLVGVVLAVAAGQVKYQSSPERQEAVPQDLGRWLGPWKAKLAPRLMQDFGERYLYRDANRQLGMPRAGERRVVFLGDSITDLWKLPEYFSSKPYVNRGIGGQITAQMVLRFHQDVVDPQPAAVIINAGINDISNTLQITTIAEIESNYEAMAEIARAHGIRVIFASVLPVNNYTEYSRGFLTERPPEQIRELNRWLKGYCERNGLVYLDYYSSLIDENQMLRRALTTDGLHPTADGYKIMAPLAEKAIQLSLK